jgi:hypothetical protein
MGLGPRPLRPVPWGQQPLLRLPVRQVLPVRLVRLVRLVRRDQQDLLGLTRLRVLEVQRALQALVAPRVLEALGFRFRLR